MKSDRTALREITVRSTHERLRRSLLNHGRQWAWDIRCEPHKVFTPEHTYTFNNLTELNNWLDAMELVYGAE